jgi:hypothetical protein
LKHFNVPLFRARRDEIIFGNHVVKRRDDDSIINKTCAEEISNDHVTGELDISFPEKIITRETLNTKTHQVQHELHRIG